ncbi:MAG: hypothetical protein IKT60_02435 [Clostridia bacterium]|nr:hypothetical protein [Clostridia bacterium]
MTYDEFVKKFAETAETVGDTVGKAANTAVKKGGELAEIAKLTLQKNNARQERDRRLISLGSLVYAARGGVELSETDMEKLYAELDTLTENIETLDAKIAKLRNSKTCMKCGRSVAKDYSYCPVCGEKF